MLELKEFRFTCINIDDTISFYSSCLMMVLHKKTESEGKVYMSFRYQRNDVFLRFEYNQAVGLGRSKWTAAMRRPRRPVASTDLLVYVASIEKILGRIATQGFVIFVDPVKISDDAIACVLVDPNGIRLRLIESIDCLVDAAGEGRIGYLTVPVKEFSTLSRTAAFYQQVFGPLALEMLSSHAIRPARPLPVKDDDARASPGRLLNRNPDKMALGMISSDAMFTVRDTELFPEDMITMIWLGNGPRESVGNLCLRYTIDRQASIDGVAKRLASDSENNDRFLGIVFVVSDLERCQTYLGAQTAFPIQISPINIMMGMVPWFSFFDTAFIHVQIREESMAPARAPKPRSSRQPTQ